MPKINNYRIFISHAWKYGESYDNLVNLLNNAPYFSYYNYSAPQERPLNPDGRILSKSEIKEKIRNKIALSQVVIVIAGMYYNYREWMEFEVSEAVRMGKPIISVKPRGAVAMPNFLELFSDRVVNWNTDSIVSAIRELY